MSHHIWSQGSRIRYVSEARVYVRYPESYSDWVRQKRRTLAGYQQEHVRKHRMASQPHSGLRSFRSEFAFGALRSFQYARNAREVGWTALLFLARAHVWFSAFALTRLTRRTHSQIWARVESTK
jgi:cellulose synthase/poly-beta-1,6-N-acetylglucosamine synthase-like glycosyltransferase